jgi:hypothetical protein
VNKDLKDSGELLVKGDWLVKLVYLESAENRVHKDQMVQW